MVGSVFGRDFRLTKRTRPATAGGNRKRCRAGGRCCLVLFALIFVSGVVPASLAAEGDDHDSAQEIRRETRELLAALKTYTASQRDEAIERIKTAQANLDRRIEALEREMAENWSEMDQAAREKSHASLQALREQRIQVAEYYGSLKSGSAAAWGHIKEGFSNAYRALHDAWEKAENDFDADE